jgi:hypothetical protein
MLAAIESRLAALIGDGLAARTHTRVVRTPAPVPEPGKGTVLVTVSAFEGEPTFQAETFAVGDGDAQKAPVRRVTALRLHARVDIAVTAAAANAAAAAAARDLALDDAATIVYLLDRADVHGGGAFTPADPDPGFLVHEFGLEKATVDTATSTAQVLFAIRADVWPVAAAADGGKITSIDRLIAPLPLRIGVDRDVLAPGGATAVRVHAFAPTRHGAANAPGTPASLAISVLSDVAPAERGTIVGGIAGPETGLRIVAVATPDTVFTYKAPAANAGPARWEYIQVHLATADNARGGLLGTAAVRLAGGA